MLVYSHSHQFIKSRPIQKVLAFPRGILRFLGFRLRHGKHFGFDPAGPHNLSHLCYNIRIRVSYIVPLADILIQVIQLNFVIRICANRLPSPHPNSLPPA